MKLLWLHSLILKLNAEEEVKEVLERRSYLTPIKNLPHFNARYLPRGILCHPNTAFRVQLVHKSYARILRSGFEKWVTLGFYSLTCSACDASFSQWYIIAESAYRPQSVLKRW